MNNTGLRQQILWELFELSNRFLQDLDIEYWVNYGTLLGFHRENGIIGHDIDIDFGCHVNHYERILSQVELLHPELSLHDTSHRHNGPKLYMSYKGFDADIYFYREEEDQLFSYEKTDWENYNAPIPKVQVFPTAVFQINEITTRVPARTEAYLETIYGNLAGDAVRNPETGYWE